MDAVLHDRAGPVFRITINRPDRRNAINAAVIEGIARGYIAARDAADVLAIVLTGAGEAAFCAGADLQPGAAFAFDFARPSTDYADLLRLAHGCLKPAVARINGACLAGGMGLLCMTDLAVAADHARFGLPEVRVGVFPMQVLSLLQRIAPPRAVREWCLTGELFDAAAAHAAGLVNYVVPAPDLDTRTDWLLARMIDKSPTAIRRGKAALRTIEAMPFEQALAYTEAQIALTALTEDAKEGRAAFVEKRAPRWTGR